MGIEEVGHMSFSECNSANIPVDIWLTREEDGTWILRANNYMPRKGSLGGETTYETTSRNRHELVSIIRSRIIPLYEAAIKKLEHMCSIEEEEAYLYYWE